MLNLPNIATTQQEPNPTQLLLGIKQPPNIKYLIKETNRLNITFQNRLSHRPNITKTNLSQAFNLIILPKL